MKYYTEIVPFELAYKLKEAGYPQDKDKKGYTCGGLLTLRKWSDYAAPTYAEVFDWFFEKGLSIVIAYNGWDCWEYDVYKLTSSDLYAGDFESDWHTAANAAIEKAIETLKEE